MSVTMKDVAVVIETSRHQIIGKVSVPAVKRLSDFANDTQRRFWSVTEAEVSPLDEPERARRVEFILVAVHEISVISPISKELPKAAEMVKPEDYLEHSFSTEPPAPAAAPPYQR